MKQSPLCSRNEGREIYFTVNDGFTKYRFTVPQALLDTECGAPANESVRKAWVKDNLADILNARPEGAPISPPFTHIIVEEIS